jgi:tetratricopeptide (TPR) repeat protein
MSVSIETRQQLAAPRRLRSLPPSFVGPPSDELLVEIPDQDLPPSFVTNARTLVERYPSSPTALARLAQAEQAAGHVQEAIAAGQATLAQTASQSDASAELAAITVLISTEQTEEAERALALTSPRGPTAVIYASLAAVQGRYDDALRRIADESSGDACSLRGWVMLKRHEYQTAIASFRQALRKTGPTPAILTNLGVAHAALGERKRAIAETRQALALLPSQRSRVGFNLASYYLAGDDYEKALAELRLIRDANPQDIEPLFAEARAHLATEHFDQAQRTLRRARTSVWAYLSDVQRGELNANLAFVDWHLDRLSRTDAATRIMSELRSIDYRSLRIAEMLPVLLSHFSDANQLRQLIAGLRGAHPTAPLWSFEVLRAVLERRFNDAVQLAVAWADEEVFDSEAAVGATYLLSMLTDDFDRAIGIGKAALKRTPAVPMLANNLAYVLALSGNTHEARRYLPRSDTPHHIATRALIELRSGRVETAVHEYERALHKAEASDDSCLPALVRLHTHMAFARFAPDAAPPVGVQTKLEATPEWDDDVRFALTLAAYARHGLALPAWLPGGATAARGGSSRPPGEPNPSD